MHQVREMGTNRLLRMNVKLQKKGPQEHTHAVIQGVITARSDMEGFRVDWNHATGLFRSGKVWVFGSTNGTVVVPPKRQQVRDRHQSKRRGSRAQGGATEHKEERERERERQGEGGDEEEAGTSGEEKGKRSEGQWEKLAGKDREIEQRKVRDREKRKQSRENRRWREGAIQVQSVFHTHSRRFVVFRNGRSEVSSPNSQRYPWTEAETRARSEKGKRAIFYFANSLTAMEVNNCVPSSP